MQKITKHSKPKHRKKIFVITGILLILVGTSVVAYSQKLRPFSKPKNVTIDTNTINHAAPSDAQKESGEDIKKQSNNSNSSNQQKPSSSSSGEQPAVSNNNTVGVEITSASKVGGSLEVRTIVQEFSSDGACTLTLAKSGELTITKSAKLQTSGTVSTCQGFSVDASKLMKGKWKLTVSYKSNKSNGSASQSVQL